MIPKRRVHDAAAVAVTIRANRSARPAKTTAQNVRTGIASAPAA
jgi:hypothetical protein